MSDLPATVAVPHGQRRNVLARLIAALSLSAEDEARLRAKERLAMYDDRLLKDIGITRERVLGHITYRSNQRLAAPDGSIVGRSSNR